MKCIKITVLVQKLQQFCWVGGFCLLVELHQEEFALQPTQQDFFWLDGQQNKMIFNLNALRANFSLQRLKIPLLVQKIGSFKVWDGSCQLIELFMFYVGWPLKTWFWAMHLSKTLDIVSHCLDLHESILELELHFTSTVSWAFYFDLNFKTLLKLCFSTLYHEAFVLSFIKKIANQK